jgi:hypothetical protein
MKVALNTINITLNVKEINTYWEVDEYTSIGTIRTIN